MYLKIFFIALLSGLSFIRLQAQNTITGAVTDTGDKGIPYVSVKLLYADSTWVKGTVTDSAGVFSFSNIQENKYLLAFSAIGYKAKVLPVTLKQPSLNLTPTVLETDDVLLEGVTVTGTSFIRKKDYVLIIPDKQQVKHANNGYDVLYNLMIPGLTVDKRKGTVSAFAGTVTLYIDGEKATYRDIQNLRPQDIKNIEYYEYHQENTPMILPQLII